MNLSDDGPRVKLKHILLDPEEESSRQLKDLLHARLEEGHGEALFDVGLEDSGEAMGFGKDEWEKAYTRVTETAKSLNAECRILMTRNTGREHDVEANEKDKTVSGKLLIRRIPEEIDDVIETRIAVVGNVDAGKSTLLGVLVKGGLDDGRGKMRVNLFRHKHEIESGRTSSVGMEIMGFDAKGDVVSSTVPGRKLSWEEIGKRSVSLVFQCLNPHVLIRNRPKSSPSPILQVTNDIFAPLSSVSSAANPITAS